ncbi:MAG TPA: class I SAM-dependent methyltransferase [Gemmatimonadales bacterium]|nr:class I SAM-dependent methyltransferase [Gemmatimonadales bacterium]
MSARPEPHPSHRPDAATYLAQGTSMEQMDGALLELLRAQGFSEPDLWLEYAQRHGFRPTRSRRLACCPDCGTESFHDIGQYVYYSTLATLRWCKRCRVAYSDTRLDPQLIRAHFESTYKDEPYFTTQRRRVFEQLARSVDRFAPEGGSVLDVGGAKGHFLAAVKRRRADLTVTLTDVSESACAWARTVYGFRAICGSVTALAALRERFDVAVLSDVIYYEPDATKLWRLLPQVVADRGAVLIRVPNTLAAIRVAQLALRTVSTRKAWARRDRVSFFNPEHLFVFSQRFLTRKLEAVGFRDVVASPAEMLLRDGASRVARLLWFWCARAAYGLTGGRVILTPSLLVSARR